MKNKKKILVASLALGSIIMAAGGGALFEIAPPDESFFSGIISLLILAAIGITASALSKNLFLEKKKANFIWIVVIFISIFTFLTATYYYYNIHLKYVVRYEDNGHIIYFIKGDTLRDDPRLLEYKTDSALIAAFHDPKLIWTPESITDAKTKLMLGYIIMIVAIGIMIFSALELYFISDQKQKS